MTLAVAVPIGAAGCTGSPDRTLYVGGTILTMDAAGTVAEAVRVEGERIAAVGTEADVRATTPAGTPIVELGERALLPGFIDAHGHFPGMGVYAIHADLNSPPIGEVENIDDIVAILAARAREERAGAWILGLGYDDTLLAERRHPTRHDLDRASADHAIVIMHISGHLAVASSRALAELGIDASTPDPEGGHIQRDAVTGEPTGVLEETAAGPVLDMLQRPSALDGLRVVRAAGRIYARAGVTTAQNGLTTRRQIRLLSWASRLGLVPIRLILWPDATAGEAILDGTLDTDTYDPLWVRVGAMKLVADGSLQGYTGYLSRPYYTTPDDDPDYRGYPRMPAAELDDRLTRYHARGLQVAVHGNGDAAIDMILDAVEHAGGDRPVGDARHIVIHAQMARDDQLDRMKQLGVIPSFFALHPYYWGDRHREVFLGPERAARISPTASALARELPFTIHADAPVVPMEALRLVWSAVNRRTRSGVVLGPDERIDAMTALRAVTIDAAYQHFEEDLKGSLEPGKLADLVILSRSPLDDPATIDSIEVLETIVGGRTIHSAAR